MALINKIRERSGIAVIVIAASLMLFIVGGDIIGSQALFGGGNQTVGEIAGETINYKDFQLKLDQARQAFEAQSGRAASEAEQQSLREQVWNQYLVDYAYKKEFDALGLKVSNEELVDMVQGNNVSPAVQQSFTNPQTGVFDKTQVISYLKNLKNLQPVQQQAWQNFEKSLAQDRLRQKYENLIRLGSYVTRAEAEKEYQAQTTKASLRYLFVPFYSVVDTTIKVTDSQLEDYLAKHKDEYKGFDSRTIQYVSFPMVPTKSDSVELYNKIKDLARGLATSTSDSTFARINSDVPTKLYWSLSEMPDQLKVAVKSFIPGSVNGPYREGNTYFIYKYGGTKLDTSSTVKASHILIRAEGTSDSAKAIARTKATDLLKQLQGGANFEQLAAANSTDQASAQRGGDLGYFREGVMVKPFNDAVFAATSTGLIPRLVESDFGFHIIKVTEPKTNVLYKIAAIGKTMTPSQATRDAIYAKADQFALESKSKTAFDESVKKDKALIVQTANRIPESATNINTLQNAREIVRWAFNDDTKMEQTSPVFETDEQYVVAILTGKSEKSNPTINDFRDELTLKVRNAAKAEQIAKKLGTIQAPTLEAIAQKYGAGALVENANDISLATGFLTSAGLDPIALGRGFGLKAGKKSKVFTGENGVFIMEKITDTPAPAIGDYSMYKANLQAKNMQASYLLNEAIRENAKVVDNRAKFF
ncbi:SurA N-terminal domain-containing protein [Runella sp.]|jgi:peptidyl-prolyl cis-trans isomerase D|uniref:peptidylprolyl isomerase n=1 Tax=Runella sp. TaxID=1960881 RepID=UPI00261B2C3F|nr:SurA N-terminal domain-containing protein [Runella sp.]